MLDNAKDELWVVRWTTDQSGAASLDDTWSALTGQTLAEASQCGWLNAIHPEDAADTADDLKASLAQRTAFRHEVRVRLQDGSYRWMLGVGAPLGATSMYIMRTSWPCISNCRRCRGYGYAQPSMAVPRGSASA